ncbi:BlaI/MecI/CopY family transcriptional regulator [Fusibacter bizertensis]
MNETLTISESEWEIMRIIWSQSPVTSTIIIKELKNVTGWMPTTVKTLLSRLVNKNIIKFEIKGRTFYYSPLVSEETCIRNEMKSVVEKVYGGTLNHETTHFYFKGHLDDQFVKQLAKALESNYFKIISDLKYEKNERLLVYTHSTQKRLHSALGLLEGPKWLRAGHLWDVLHIAPLACFDDLSAENAILHTFTQMLIQQINPSVPYWLQQAIAAYESHWLTKEKIAQAISTLQTNSTSPDPYKLIQMQVMRNDFLSFKEIKGYELGYTVAEFIDLTFGIDKIAELIRKPYDYLGVFDVDENQFWCEWREFLIKNYQNAY